MKTSLNCTTFPYYPKNPTSLNDRRGLGLEKDPAKEANFEQVSL